MTTKVCTTCAVDKDLSAFHKHKDCKHGYNTVCKECRKVLSKNQYRTITIQYRLLSSAKARSKKRGLAFNIDMSDVVIPAVCPVFGTPFVVNTEYAATIDRKDPMKGYVKGNVQVISYRANMLKNNASSEELEKVLEYVRACEITFA